MDMKNIISILEIGANIGTIAAAGFLIFEFRAAKKAYELSHKDYRIRNEKEEINKAIELAKYYSELIPKNIGYLHYIFKQSELNKYIDNLDIDSMVEFDMDEVKAFLKMKEIDEVRECLFNLDLKILINANNIISDVDVEEYINSMTTLNLHSHIDGKTMKEAAATLVDKRVNDENNILSDDIQEVVTDTLMRYNYYVERYRNKFFKTVTETLNNLEYFSMSFNTGVADDEVVYQSLHQSFLKMIKMMYFYIAFQNVDGKDKYYTNIIDLFNRWRDRYMEAAKSEVESKRATRIKKGMLKK